MQVGDGETPFGVLPLATVLGEDGVDDDTGPLAHVVGECKDEPNLKQIFSKSSPYSLLITEYVDTAVPRALLGEKIKSIADAKRED